MRNILIVDDEVDILEKFEFLFEDLCDEVLTADHASKALQKIEDGESISCIICDVNMPDIDGIEFIRRLRNDLNSKIPVIFYSGRGDDQDMIESSKHGTFDFIMKPNFQQLEQSILKAFELFDRMKSGEDIDLQLEANETYKELVEALKP